MVLYATPHYVAFVHVKQTWRDGRPAASVAEVIGAGDARAGLRWRAGRVGTGLGRGKVAACLDRRP